MPSMLATPVQKTDSLVGYRWLLWILQAALGGIAGFAVGHSSITTRCTMLELPGRATRVMVRVHMVGMLVSEETGFVRIPEDGPTSIRALSLTQEAWLYGIPVAGAAAGLMAALASAALLVKSFESSRRHIPENWAGDP